jgi:hypothetical protein
MAGLGFNSVVAARARTAMQILETADLLEKYEALGGLRRDLAAIGQAGLEAEAANLAQSQSSAAGKGATVEVLAAFAALQREYAAVMSVVRAVRVEQARNSAPAQLIGKLDGIIANEAELSVTVSVDDGGAKRRRVRKSKSQEALRAEIAKDARALLELSELRDALAERRVDGSRLEALRQSAEDLSGLLAVRSASKGVAKASVQAERDAVKRQGEIWKGCSRLLWALADKDERVRSLLQEARR